MEFRYFILLWRSNLFQICYSFEMDEEQALHTRDGAKPKRKTASSPSYSCCGNDLAIKSTAVRLSIVNKFNFEYVTFAKEAFENLVDFRIKAIKEEAFDEIIVPLTASG